MHTLNALKDLENREDCDSPEYLRMSLAAAMTLGLVPGLFYRNARLHCINLLLTYRQGCAANCAYCGLSGKRQGAYEDKSFIRVTWPKVALGEIVERIATRLDVVKRICISQITNTRSVRDTVAICRRLRSAFDVPVSVLVAPTILTRDDLAELKAAGADKIGVALDLATPDLFARFRGAGVGGPHRWDRYLACLTDAIALFGARNAGAHLMTGMGETEREMVACIQRVRDMGGWTHLFSFYPEANSQLADHPMPDMAHYRRIQLARYVIDGGIARAEDFAFDDDGRIADFGLAPARFEALVDGGEAFRTSGCEGYDGEVACNRPYANSRPGPDIRNFPFKPEAEDIARVRRQMGLAPSAATRGGLLPGDLAAL